eukprot:TRINITY_DN23762_c0_g1_i1.p1 TRINITY_DN23762_c0_g1~~TRINITY_DN23762_c0_g1_i1.p1  ORF type:complete len:124 (+),score=40.19 TRINITY_DN23762_c0_g1_i1:200-571(+)
MCIRDRWYQRRVRGSALVVAMAVEMELAAPAEVDEQIAKTMLCEGTGEPPTPGCKAEVHVKGWVKGDPEAVITCTRTQNGEPVHITVGEGQVLAGVDETLSGMRVGERCHGCLLYTSPSPRDS